MKSYSISEVSAKLDIPESTIRYYEKKDYYHKLSVMKLGGGYFQKIKLRSLESLFI